MNIKLVWQTDRQLRRLLVNDMIKIVKNKGLRKQGKPSQARKTFAKEYYEADNQNMYRHKNVEFRLFVSSIFRLQLTTISIIDDSSKLLDDNMKENQQHSRYSIISRLCWSKHVNGE